AHTAPKGPPLNPLPFSLGVASIARVRCLRYVPRYANMKPAPAAPAVPRNSPQHPHHRVVPAAWHRWHDVLAETARAAHFAGHNLNWLIDDHYSESTKVHSTTAQAWPGLLFEPTHGVSLSSVRSFFLFLSRLKWLRRWMETSSLTRRLSTRFVAGETLDEALAVARKLNAEGITVTLDHLGESVSTLGEAAEARDVYLRTLDAIHRNAIQGNVSLKLTQFGLDLSGEQCLANVDR